MSRKRMSDFELLRQVQIFEELDDNRLRLLGHLLQSMHVPRGERIFEKGDAGNAMFIVKTGEFHATIHEDGREAILATFKTGDFFGEMSLLDGQSRSASVHAAKRGCLLRLAREDFLAHLEAHPATALRILAEMSLRLRKASSIIGNLSLLDVFGRVARTIVDLAEQEGVSTDEGIFVAKRPTQQELASMVGTTRETVSRVLSELNRRGLITMSGRSITLSHGFTQSDLSDLRAK